MAATSAAPNVTTGTLAGTERTAVPLLIAGVAVPSYFLRLLPRWVGFWGIALGLAGQLSLLSLLFPCAVLLRSGNAVSGLRLADRLRPLMVTSRLSWLRNEKALHL